MVSINDSKGVVNMKLYDTRIPVHETPKGEPAMDTVIEKLDEMLTQYGVDHCFALATDAEMDADPKPLLYHLFYQAEQNVELTLVIGLWLKLYLNRDNQRIIESIMKSLSKEVGKPLQENENIKVA